MIEIIHFLQANGVLDFINAGMTVVLAFFAFVQLWQIRAQRRRELRAAYGALWVEHWRMWTVSENWRREDLISLADAGLFDPDNLRPRDWGAILPLLGVLGTQAARFGGNAYAIAENAVGLAQHLQMGVAERQRVSQAPGSPQQRELLAEFQRPLTQLQKRTRGPAREAAILFEDALKSAPKWLQKETLNLDGLRSSLAEHLRSHLERN